MMKHANYKSHSILLFFLLLFLSTQIKAQNNQNDAYKNAFEFGLYHSFNLTTITGTFPDINTANIVQETSLSSPRFTFDVGMTLDYYINKRFSLQIDALYTYNGGHFVSTRTIYNEVGKIEHSEWFTYSMSYFQFPLALVVYPTEQLYLSGGAYAGTLIHSQKYYHWYEPGSQPIKDLNSFDYGLQFGLGFNMSYLKVGFQYSYGLADMINNSSYNLHHSDYKLVVRWKFFSDIRNKK